MESNFMGFGETDSMSGGTWNTIRYHFIDNKKLYYTILVIIVIAIIAWYSYKKFYEGNGENLTMLTETNLKNDYGTSKLAGRDWDSMAHWDDPSENPSKFTVAPPNQK